ncbi:citryl-CoA lyase [Candidatus Wolfebacteria bacterium]|nr:citryl-CoA lyase [Candidatus Wolfebacteria bacterium]
MKWKTKISVHKDGELRIRGHKLTELIAKYGFIDGIFLIIEGRLPAKNEAELLSACLLSCIDHGVEAPSAFIGRVVASTGNSVNAAIAANILAIGDHHGGAIEQAMILLSRPEDAKTIVREVLSRKERLPGYGHKIYKDFDPRAKALFKRAAELEIKNSAMEKTILVEKELKEQSGKTLPLNIDGAIAAILLALGFNPKLGKAFFALGRMPGMMAHILEEITDEKPYRRFEESDVEYEGPELK